MSFRKLLPAAAAVALLAAPILTALPDFGGPVKVGDNLSWLADHKVQATNGKEFDFRQLLPEAGKEASAKEGTVFVISFWAYKCPWSRGWDGELNAIASEYASKGVKVFGVDSSKHEVADKEGITAVNEYIAENKLGFPVLIDQGSKIAEMFQAKTTPHIYVIDRKGNVVFTGAIDNDMQGAKAASERKTYLRNALDEVLAGKTVTLAETKPQGCSIKWFGSEKKQKRKRIQG